MRCVQHVVVGGALWWWIGGWVGVAVGQVLVWYTRV